MRLETWPLILRATITKHAHTPFVWGQSDCSFVFDAIRDMTGFDPGAEMRGYSSEREALAKVKAAGYSTMLEFVEANFSEIDPALAQRGDIGYPRDIPHPLMSPAIIDGPLAYSKHPAGGVVISRDLLARAWAV